MLESRSPAFTVYPAIDVRDGAVVRLRQGDYDCETRYAADPFELALQYSEAGAGWLHLVDLDAARLGGYSLHGLVRRITTETSLKMQTGGGIRKESDIEELLDAGAKRVVIGSLAVSSPESVIEWIGRYGSEQVTVALDVREDAKGGWSPSSHGWTRDSGCSLESLVVQYEQAGLHHLLCTDISRDGMLSGPNFQLYRRISTWGARLSVQASGGARDLDDVVLAKASGCAGIVLGKSLLEGRLDLAEALRC